MKWFFCTDDNPMMYDLAQMAILTAKQNTNLEPYCIYSGNKQEWIKTLQNHGVTVILHDHDLHNAILNVFGDRPKVVSAFLRVDIPLLADDEYILYTDTDVLFLGDCKGLEEIKPDYIAVCPCANPYDTTFLNSGVMVMNVRSMRETHKEFTDFIRDNIKSDWASYDQIAYIEFYLKRGMVQWMPIEYNWKPFWHKDYAFYKDKPIINRKMPIQILHFVGYKPYELNKYKPGLSIYRNEHAEEWANKWRSMFDESKIWRERVKPTMIRKGNLVPFHNFKEMDGFLVTEEMVEKWGIGWNVAPDHFEEHIRHMKPGMYIVQQPRQLIEFLRWIYEHKEEIDSYLELGIFHGGTFLVIDSFLHVIKNDYQGSTGIDCKKCVPNLEKYLVHFAKTKVIEAKTEEWEPDRNYDLIFIDDLHEGEHVWGEYSKYKGICKYMAFHDICNKKMPGMVEVWEKIRKNHEYWEFLDQPRHIKEKEDWVMGIGVIKV